jgi:hypothetical protein
MRGASLWRGTGLQVMLIHNNDSLNSLLTPPLCTRGGVSEFANSIPNCVSPDISD